MGFTIQACAVLSVRMPVSQVSPEMSAGRSTAVADAMFQNELPVPDGGDGNGVGVPQSGDPG